MATLRRSFDVSKFVKNASKSIENISTGFNDPSVWVSTGSYLLNKLISGDFYKGIPLGKVVMFAGASGSGKSYICSGNIIRQAQEQGIFVVLIDTENALDEKWLNSIGVNTSEDKLQRISITMIDDVAKFTSEFVKAYKEDFKDVDVDQRPNVLFVIDSLGALMTPTEISQFEAGDMKGDFGRKAKQLRSYVMNCVNSFGDLNIGLIATNHTYASQDMFNPDPKISGGEGFVYASSIVVAMGLGKLKGESTLKGSKAKVVHGIRAMFQVNKSRYSKPFEKAELEIPYDTGMSKFTGLVEFFEQRGVLVKVGNQLSYTCKDGTVIKEFRDNITDDQIEQIMLEWDEDRFGFKKNLVEQPTETAEEADPIEEVETSKKDKKKSPKS